MQIVQRFGPGLAAAALIAVSAGGADAATLVYTGKEEVVATRAKCVGGGVRYENCVSTATFNKTKLDGKGDAFFLSAFDAWNEGNPDDAKWTLVTTDANGDPLSVDGKMVVTTFAALASYTEGGARIRVQWRDVTTKYKQDYFWSQAVQANYTLDNEIKDEPYFFMDVKTEKTKCSELKEEAPLYPCQYNTRKFFDEPKGPWPGAAFRGHAYISEADRENRVLTIYDGIDYGFRLSATPVGVEPVPLPAASPLLLSALSALGAVVLRRRRRRAR